MVVSSQSVELGQNLLKLAVEMDQKVPTVNAHRVKKVRGIRTVILKLDASLLERVDRQVFQSGGAAEKALQHDRDSRGGPRQGCVVRGSFAQLGEVDRVTV